MGNVGNPTATLGSDAAIEQGTRLRWTNTGMEVQTRIWRGPADKVLEQYKALKTVAAGTADYDELVYDAGRGTATLEAQRAGSPTVTGDVGPDLDADPRWELMTVEERVPIEYHERWRNLTTQNVQDVVRRIDQRLGPPDVWDDVEQEALFRLMLRGVTDYPAHMYVARRTQITTRRKQITAAFGPVGKCTQTGSRKGAGSISNETAGLDIDNPIFIGIKQIDIDWLVRSPTVREVERRRWSIDQEWWGIPISHEVDENTVGGRLGWSGTLYTGGYAP